MWALYFARGAVMARGSARIVEEGLERGEHGAGDADRADDDNRGGLGGSADRREDRRPSRGRQADRRDADEVAHPLAAPGGHVMSVAGLVAMDEPAAQEFLSGGRFQEGLLVRHARRPR